MVKTPLNIGGPAANYQGASSDVYENRPPEFYEPYLKRFRNLQSPILDMGAGYGLFLQYAQSKGFEGVGLEVDPFRIEECTKRGVKACLHDLAEPMAMFEDNYFGGIYFGQVIEHLTYPVQKIALREAFRVLKPGHELIVTSPGKFEQSEWSPDHCGLLTIHELRVMLAEVGFVEINTKIGNYLRPDAQIPKQLLEYIWQTYQPDILSSTASAVCRKPLA